MSDDEFHSVKEAMRLSALMSVRRAHKQMMEIHNGGITLLDEPTIDEYATVTIGSWGGYLIQVVPMLFNDRLVMSPKRAPYVFDFGWCYQRGPAAYLAAAVWDPQIDAEPKGFKKRVAALRRAGEDVEDELMTPGEAYTVGMFAMLDEIGQR